VGAKQTIFTPVIQVDETDSSSRIFQPNIVALFHFLLLPLTAKTIGIGGIRADFLSSRCNGRAGK
jgi:hypothetical protein